MDLIRIFIDTTFSKITDRYFSIAGRLSSPDLSNEGDGIPIDEVLFVDECRIHHPELSDDQVRMIFGLFRDEWAFLPSDISDWNPKRKKPERNIFNVLFHFTQEVLRVKHDKPLVIFRHLLRWREVSLNMGEDALIAAFLAHRNRLLMPSEECTDGDIRKLIHLDGIDFCSWPTILHNDNPYLDYLFNKHKLCELHSHLFASTDNFTISWVSLMNNINGLDEEFLKLGRAHDESRAELTASAIYSYVIFACHLRLSLWSSIQNVKTDSSQRSLSLKQIQSTPDIIANKLQMEIDKERVGNDELDYIPADVISPMRVIAGERKFLYAAFRYILFVKDKDQVSRKLYEYILAKNKFRSFLIQVDSNRGFSNFKRYQDLKTIFMRPAYKMIVGKLAVWEARELNYTDIFETRIPPLNNTVQINALKRECINIDSVFRKDPKPEWSLLIHFLKHPQNFKKADSPGPSTTVRDGELRMKIHNQSLVLRKVVDNPEWRMAEESYLSRIRGIDAASSEIGCRPEVFAQTFRFLKASGFAATFHVGEDFYDIADGLRAIDEAIVFLGLEAGDRLGHALALGIDPDEFYDERHNFVALPAQWMLDNVVWLYFSSQKYNTPMEPSTEDFLLRMFRDLVRRIGYERSFGKGEYRKVERVELTDYYQSMLLRGDNPSAKGDQSRSLWGMSQNSWDHYAALPAVNVNEIRIWNKEATLLYEQYLTDDNIIANGRMIKSFVVPPGYRKLIREMQNKMMMLISKMQLGIECCPSSNYKIGYCKRYDRHPIFRFMPVKGDNTQYPLAVTVNTDDLGVFSTSLPNEYSLLALALMKMRDVDGNHVYSTQEVYDWVERIIKNGEKFAFKRTAPYVKFNPEQQDPPF
ncbi:MAG: hypothetical protein K2H60_09950 [Muribaculaceae bacterium]|nr:hypothetical protein [Muribaculaceae bacterium]